MNDPLILKLRLQQLIAEIEAAKEKSDAVEAYVALQTYAEKIEDLLKFIANTADK